MPPVESYHDSGLTVITLGDSAGGNLLNAGSLEGLHRALDGGNADPQCRALLLRSNGDRFCLGMDLSLLSEAPENPETARAAVRSYSDLLLKMVRSPKPVVALVDGAVKGGGLGLLAACDIVLASPTSSFEFSEVLFGLIPANVLPFLLERRMSPGRAGYLILSARRLDGEEAAALQLVDEIHPEEGLEKGVRMLIRRLFRASPHALAEAKRFVRSLHGLDLETACSRAGDQLLKLASRADVRRAAESFAEGEAPPWFGRFRPRKSLTGKEMP